MIRKNQMPSFFDEFFGENFLKNAVEPVKHFNVPAINIKESESDFQIEIAAPGMEKSDFKVSLEQNILTISTEKKEEKTEEAPNYTRKEFGYMSFKRSFTLPEDKVDTDAIEAKYDAGVLKLHIPKKILKVEEPKVKSIVID
jgi:HSP20 family protein